MRLVSYLSTMLLVACSVPQFDNNEYMLITQVKYHATEGSKMCARDPVGAFTLHGNEVREKTDILVMYSEHLPNNAKTHDMALKLQDMTQGLTKQSPSSGYCKAKFDNIAVSADLIHKVTGAERDIK